MRFEAAHQQHLRGDEQFEHAEDALECVRRQLISDHGTGECADDDADRELLHQRPIHGAALMVRANRHQGGEPDARKRGADGEVHDDGGVHALAGEHPSQHRHDDQAATDAEQAGEQAGTGAEREIDG